MSTAATLFEAVKTAAMIRLPGVPVETVDHEARWTVSEFLRETRCWRAVVDIPLTDGLAEYDLPGLATDESVAVLMGASMEGISAISLHPVPEILLSDGTTGTPTMVGMVNDRRVRVYPVPTIEDSGKALVLDVAKTLLVDTESTPPDVLSPWQSHLLDGLLLRLYSMPDKPWSNARSADAHLRRFENAKASVRRELDGGRAFGGLTMRIPRFGV